MTLTEPRPAAGRSAPPPAPPPLGSRAGNLQPRPRTSATAAKRWTLGRVFTVGATVAALLALLAIVSGALALSRLTEARSTLLDRVGPAVLASQDLSSAILNQETGVRGFELTSNEAFLTPYQEGLAAEERALAVLRASVAQPELRESADELDAVERATQAWRGEYAEPAVAAVRAGAPGSTTDPARGRALFDAVRTQAAALDDGLEAQRTAARQRLNDSADALRGIGIVIAAVMAAFLVAAAVGLRRGVIAPIARLAGEVRQVVSGDVAQKIHTDGPREIVELGEDVEAMRRHIRAELATLQEAHRLLDEQARDLERSNRDLEQFAYVASHDLQEPLRKVSSFCSMLQRRYAGQLDDRADQYIGFAVDGAQRMQRLINDLLAFSRVGRTTSAFEPVDLRALGEAAMSQLEAVRAETGGTIDVGDLPTVQGDPALLRQLLLNLVGNALKFRREDVPPVVRVTAQRAGDDWEIAVADNGIGIEPDYSEKIFVIFQRLHGRDQYTGTGIGLALAKKIVEFHGGRIWLDTTPRDEPGTTVRFTLPVAPPGAGPAGGAAPTPELEERP